MIGNTYAFCLATALTAFTLSLWPMGLLRRVPVAVHNLAWAVSLFVVGSGVIHYLPDTLLAWTLITAGIVTFNIAMLLPTLALPDRPVPAQPDRPLLSPAVFWLMVCGYAVGFLLFLRSETQKVGLGGILHNAASIRAYQSTSGFQNAFPLPFKLLFYLGPFLFVIVLNGWLVFPALRRANRIGVLLFVVLSLVATLGRTYLFIAVLWEVGVLILRAGHRPSGDVTDEAPNVAMTSSPGAVSLQRGRRSRGLAYLAILGVLVATFQILATAEGKTSSTVASVQSNVSPILQGSPWTSLLIYGSSGIPAFSQLTSSTNHSSPPTSAPVGQPIVGNYNPQTWGRATFQAILKVVPVFPPWQQVPPFTYVPIETNTYTWYEPYYRDFRGPGVIILTFLSGSLLISLVRRRHQGSAWLLAASLLVGLTAFAPYANKLGDVLTLEMLFVLALLGRRVRRRTFPTTATAVSRHRPALLRDARSTSSRQVVQGGADRPVPAALGQKQAPGGERQDRRQRH